MKGIGEVDMKQVLEHVASLFRGPVATHLGYDALDSRMRDLRISSFLAGRHYLLCIDLDGHGGDFLAGQLEPH